MNININVPAVGGGTAGTVAHAVAYLQGVTLHVDTNTRGNICLYARSADGQYDEIVALYVPDFDEKIRSTYVDYENCYFAPSPGRTDQTVAAGGQALFGPLTPAAWDVVNNFIKQCVDSLKAIIETDGLGYTYSVRIEVE